MITTTASVMLKAELDIPAGADPYLRWSWKGKVLAKGTLGNGFGQILWVAPSDQGVYTITLELFPELASGGHGLLILLVTHAFDGHFRFRQQDPRFR